MAMELDYDYLAKLVERTQMGDSDAFAELYTATYQKQYRFAYQYTKDSYLAQDILQDVYILVLKNIHALKNPRLFVSWLHQITFRICFDTTQKTKRQEQDIQFDTSDEKIPYHRCVDYSTESNPEKYALTKDTQQQLINSIYSLPQQFAQPIIMRYYNNMAIDEIADAMDCSRSTIKRRLHKGQKLLEAKLARRKEGLVLSKDNIPTFQSEELSLNNAEIPTLDTQTANQLLNNVFNACDMDPSSIPVEVLESWGNYKKPSFSLGRFLAYIFTILLVLLPLMFIHPTIIAERKNVKSATNAVYDIELKTLLPIRDASADLDGRPIALTKNGSHSYSAEITQNGTLTITAASVNGQTVTRTYQVSHLDTDKPELVNSYSQDGVVYLEILDTFSGIDYDHITGITPESVNTDTGVIAFHIPDNPTTVTIPDNAGNELTLLLSPVN